jgi:toxin ParE1/3/4
VAQSRIIWSASAAADVDAIAAFVARDSRRYAAAIVERLLESAGALAEFPNSGRAVPEVGDDSFREVSV